MDQLRIREACNQLKKAIERYEGSDTEVVEFSQAVFPLLTLAASGGLVAPVDWRSIPGALYFSEGTLRKYSDLETAFAEFRIEITGGESDVLRQMRQRRPQ